ncbi:hypothetical protein U1Q18_006716 [Sarracenia purpurea var. burkii]
MKMVPPIGIRRVSSTQARWDLVDVADSPTLAATLYAVESPRQSDVKCVKAQAMWFVLRGFILRGAFTPDVVTRLDQLRVLNLMNDSLRGPILRRTHQPPVFGFNRNTLFVR